MSSCFLRVDASHDGAADVIRDRAPAGVAENFITRRLQARETHGLLDFQLLSQQGRIDVLLETTARRLHQTFHRAARDIGIDLRIRASVRERAVGERPGKFELANSGTLFLDEVCELPLPAQAKLLRVLQGGQLQRLGSDRDHHVDVRLIAASNRNLADEVRAGRLRADFYHRLSVHPLLVPPRRERGRDVLVLAGFFLEENRSRLGLGGLWLDGGAQAALLGYDWPGNVRELEHLLRGYP